MTQSEEYVVPAGFGQALLVEKRSKFLSRIWLAQTEEQALSRIKETRQEHWDATHNVYAYRIRGGQTRYSDDGEPQGTSGLPTLNILTGKDVFNVCCVVTRYYGGILLGAGGLARAYSTAAKMALDNAGIRTVRQWNIGLLSCSYAALDQVKMILKNHGGVIENADYGADVLLDVLLPVDTTSRLCENLREISSGAIVPEIVDTVFRAVW